MNNYPKKKITYILGAGASAGTNDNEKILPVNANFPKYLKNLVPELNKIAQNSGFINKHNNVATDLKWLAENAEEYGSPDTFAKYLYLKNDIDNYECLKRILAFYFIVEQTLIKRRKIDKRALTFLISVMEKGNIFPENIKILNWNYDFQIQLAAEQFKEEKYYIKNGIAKHDPPIIDYYPKVGNKIITTNFDHLKENTTMVHLNGIAGCYYNNGYIFNDILIKRNKTYSDIINDLYNKPDEKKDLILFSWDHNPYIGYPVQIAKEIIKNTNILVVIGYSFPFFNRKIDNEIFKALTENNELEKIYYQEPDEKKDGNYLKNQFNLDENINIQNIRETDRYYVPFEL